MAASAATHALLTLALAGAGLLLPALWLLYLMAEWHNDWLIITDQRVIRREKTILAFEESLAELPLESVHEVTFDIPPRDAFAHLFNYGTVFIRTAGDSGNMTLPMMTHPEALQALLLRNRQEFRRRLQERARARVEDDAEALLSGAPLSSTPAPPGFTRPLAPGLFSTRFSDPQGNIVYRKHLSVWLGHIFLPLVLLIGCAILLLLQLMPGVAQDFGLVGLLAGGAPAGRAHIERSGYNGLCPSRGDRLRPPRTAASRHRLYRRRRTDDVPGRIVGGRRAGGSCDSYRFQ